MRIVEPRPGLLANAKPDWTLAACGTALACIATLVFLARQGVAMPVSCSRPVVGIAVGRS